MSVEPTPPPFPPDVAPLGYEPRLSPHARLRRWLAHTGPEYRVGTLTYTRLGLFMVFVWLLWGDLVWTLMESIFPVSMPLQLERIGVPKEWIGYMMGTVGAIMNMTLVPVVSFRSDRTRTRWGRRIPFLLFSTPFLCLFLAILGFSDDIGRFIQTSPALAKLGIPPVALTILLMGALIVLYDVFNVFVNSIYWYLFRDVVPDAFLGRFMAGFRMVQTCASMIWGAFLYGRIETHTRSIYVGAAVIYFLGFGLMCLMIREGHYPPPDDYIKSEPWPRKVFHSIRTYARECFSHPVFVLFYLSQALFALGMSGAMYKNFFYLRHLHMTPKDLGTVIAVMSPILLALQYPMGWMVDRIHPIRAYLIGATILVPVYVSGYFINAYTAWGFALNAFTIYFAYSAIQQPLVSLEEAAKIPLMMRIFPAAQYGQFSSASALLRHFTLVFGTIAGATFMGWTNRRYGDFGNAYACLWHAAFQLLGVMCLWTVFLYWRRHGAERFHYDPAPTA